MIGNVEFDGEHIVEMKKALLEGYKSIIRVGEEVLEEDPNITLNEFLVRLKEIMQEFETKES